MPATFKSLPPGSVQRIAAVRLLLDSGEARRRRELARLTPGEIAHECGVGLASVLNWEALQAYPSGEAALKYADLMDELQRLLERSRQLDPGREVVARARAGAEARSAAARENSRLGIEVAVSPYADPAKVAQEQAGARLAERDRRIREGGVRSTATEGPWVGDTNKRRGGVQASPYAEGD
jgi:transcriptional regulator with XRE-family HTH domain